jgi:CBS domain-containing protein
VRARDLAQPLPTVSLDSDVLEAARAMAQARHPGLVVVVDSRPYTVLPGSQVLRALVPSYIQEEPSLARALDEQGADELLSRLARRSVRELVASSQDRRELPIVDADATALEIAAVMAQMRSPLIAVVDDGEYLGAVTVSGLLEQLLCRDEGTP